MRICGFQKMTLLDFPGKVACTVFTGGCNMRCPFCHNALLVNEAAELETIPEETILSYLKKRQGILDGVAITGGEPLLWPNLRGFIEKVRALGFLVKLDTNGTKPAFLKALAHDGLLDYVAVDIKNSKEKYALTCGVPDFDIRPVEETVSFLLERTVPFEFRTTVVSEFHTTSDIRKIGEWIRGADRYFLQAFTSHEELVGNMELHAASKEEMEEMRQAAAPYVGEASIRGL
ncbi:MAG: anaerobic ribonucleoside-triphosphate reductase activating protein [Lachnospiraceae bacterium]|nr:anaerobic ribonucleoside-triphosphate reductase activating protein [Lachnospiraceae bacterium]